MLLAFVLVACSEAMMLHPRVSMLLKQLERSRSLEARSDCTTECHVAQYGAKCDGVSNDTLALQAAIDECAGTVALPENQTCLTHSLVLRNGSRLKIPPSAVLKAYPNAAAWDNRSLYLMEVRNAVLGH